ncbi:MAG TPA: hypothetical protein VJZ78_03930 [Anaerolineales bacterium]|nr:hypothetical protein [Anaerolineales bacterium]
MIISKESLLRIARDTVRERTQGEFARKYILSIFLTGSLLTEDPLMGNSTDIDLVFIHSMPPALRREVIPLNPDIHLDIKHNPREEYEPARNLRTNPWIGPEIYRAVQLYDPDHFFDFTQAAVRDKYDDPLNAHARASLNAGHARAIWGDLEKDPGTGKSTQPKMLLRYLKSISHAANVLPVIKDPILGERRFLLDFPAIANAFDLPELGGELYSLLGAGQLKAEKLDEWLKDWEKDLVEAGTDAADGDARIHPARVPYYRSGFETAINEGTPSAILWPLLHTWSLAVSKLPIEKQSAWKDACQSLGMLNEGMTSNLHKLDLFLDRLEGMLESWKGIHGINESDREEK